MESITALAEKSEHPYYAPGGAKGVLSDSHRWPIGIYRSAFPDVRRAVEDSDCPQRPNVASLLLGF
jgi:hypothetical protein